MPFFYHAFMRVDGILWYHTVARTLSVPKVYAHTLLPVIHNYGLTLEFAGYIVDPDMGFVSLYNVTRYKPPIELYRKYGIYSYPALVTRSLLTELFMSAIGESLIEIKKEGRLAYPDTTKNTVLMPGSVIETLIVSEYRLPERMVLRIGAKRYGVLYTRLVQVKPRIIEHTTPNYPYNTKDVKDTSEYVVLLKHKAGDVAIMGCTKESYQYKVRIGNTIRAVTLPVLKGALEYDW